MFGFLAKTRTLMGLEVPASVYDCIAERLREAGYDHAFRDGAIAMEGIGLIREPDPVQPAHRPIASGTAKQRPKNSAPGAI